MRTKSPRQRCEAIGETWGPHPGCAEFMSEPEVWTCTDPATHVVKYPDSVNRDVANGRWLPSYMHVPSRLRMCRDHAVYAVDTGPLAARAAYRYRTI